MWHVETIADNTTTRVFEMDTEKDACVLMRVLMEEGEAEVCTYPRDMANGEAW